jgi:hypothetical protein
MALMIPQKTLVTAQGIKTVESPKREFKFSDEREWIDKTFSALGPLDDIDLFFGRCIVAKYLRDTVGTIGLIASEQTRLEDKYQGKVGLLLKKGPLAFNSAPGRDYGGANPPVGSWVMYHNSSGYDADIICSDGVNRVSCRVLEDAELISCLRWPSRIW